MKKIITTFVLLLSLIFVNETSAQMASAKKIVWDLSQDVKVNTTQNTVWNYLNDAEMLKKLSNGYVKSVSLVEDDVVSINVLFSNGNKRYGKIVQSSAQYKFMVITINNESLPKGVKTGEIAIFTKSESDETSSITWKAKINGNKKGKEQLINQLNAEFESYKVGFSKI